jgi:hypothetical protein
MRGFEAAERESADLMNSVTRALMSAETPVGVPRALNLTVYNHDPGILILSRAEETRETPRCSGPLELRPTGEAGAPAARIGTAVDLGKVTSAATDWLTVPPGPHAFTWLARADAWSRFLPAMECTVKIRFGGIVAERRRMTVYPPSMETPYALAFEAPEDAEVSLTFERLDEEPAVRSVRSVDLPRAAFTLLAATTPDGAH